MIRAGHVVAVPWGLDEYACVVLSRTSYRRADATPVHKITVQLPMEIAGGPEVCPCCGHTEVHSETLSINVESVQLLPCKPAGWWVDHVPQSSDEKA